MLSTALLVAGLGPALLLSRVTSVAAGRYYPIVLIETVLASLILFAWPVVAAISGAVAGVALRDVDVGERRSIAAAWAEPIVGYAAYGVVIVLISLASVWLLARHAVGVPFSALFSEGAGHVFLAPWAGGAPEVLNVFTLTSLLGGSIGLAVCFAIAAFTATLGLRPTSAVVAGLLAAPALTGCMWILARGWGGVEAGALLNSGLAVAALACLGLTHTLVRHRWEAAHAGSVAEWGE